MSFYAEDYKENPNNYEIRFQDENIIIGILTTTGGDPITDNDNKIIDKAYELYLEKWKALFQENQLQITGIILRPGYTSWSNKLTDLRVSNIPGWLSIDYEDLIIKESKPLNIDIRIFRPRRHSRNNELGDEYNNIDLTNGVDMTTSIVGGSDASRLLDCTGSVFGSTFNEIYQSIEKTLSGLILFRERIKNAKKDYVLRASNKLASKYNLSNKDALDFITRNNDNGWVFDYKTIEYDKMILSEYDKILEDNGYNEDCNIDSWNDNYVDGCPVYIKNRKIKQLVGIKRK